MNTDLLLATLNLSLGGLVFLLGLIILRENPNQRLNRLVSMLLFFGGSGAILAATAFLAGRPGGETGRGALELLQNMSYVWEFFFPTLFLFASVFPEERAFARKTIALRGIPWRPGFGVLIFAPHIFHFGLMVVLTFWKPELSVPEVGGLRYFGPIVGVASLILNLFLLVHRGLFSLVNLGFGLGTMLLLYNSYRRTEVPRLRQQISAIAVGLGLSLLCYSFATLIPGLFNFQVNEAVLLGFTIAALMLGPGSIAYAMVRYKFLDVKLLARRGILYALVSAALVGVYLLVVSQLNRFVTNFTGADTGVFEPVLLVMALVLFQPVVSRLEQLLDQMFLRDPGDYRNVVRELGRDLQTTMDLETLLSRTITTLGNAMLLRRAYILAFTNAGPVLRTGAGEELDPGVVRWLSHLLPKVSARESLYRTANGIEGLEKDEIDALQEEFGVTLVAPLRWRGDLVGALLLGDKLTETDFTSEDVSLLGSLAAQLAVALQNALLVRDRIAVARFEEELNLARSIQRNSLLSEFPRFPRCEVHALSIPSKHVGGDFYDVVSTEDGGFLMAIADVSGKGVPAALLSSMLQASLRTQAGSDPPVGEILENINRLLYRSTSIQQFATFFLARVDCDRMEVRFSNAGHNWPIVLRHGGTRDFLERGGPVLGIFEASDYEEGEVTLRAGDRLVLYTDGISEASDITGEQFGDERLADFVEALPRELSSSEVANRILEELRSFLDGVEPQDDMTLLVMRVLEPTAAELEAQAKPEAAATR